MISVMKDAVGAIKNWRPDEESKREEGAGTSDKKLPQKYVVTWHKRDHAEGQLYTSTNGGKEEAIRHWIQMSGG